MSAPSRTPRAAIRTLVCDDSAFMRRLLADALTRCGFEVVGEAKDGAEALELCVRLRPDVLTLDMQMPGLSGIDVLRRLRGRGPGIVVVSAHTSEGSALAVEALTLGAADVVRKPAGGLSLGEFTPHLAASVEAAAATRRVARPAPAATRPAPPRPAVRPSRRRSNAPRLVLIASSTGGPQALASLIPSLPSPCGAGVVIVQHMPAGFTKQLAQRLDAGSALNVREATEGDRIDPRTALIAPGGWHLRIAHGVVRLSAEPPVGGLRPRADITIRDAARDWADRVVLLVLTGMGADGLEGARVARPAGATVLTQSERSCVVYGMPRSVEVAGLSDVVVGLDGMPRALEEALR